MLVISGNPLVWIGGLVLSGFESLALVEGTPLPSCKPLGSKPPEAWAFQILSDPTGTSAIWAARRVPDTDMTVVATRRCA